MDDVIKKIEALKQKYPLHIKTYKPVDEGAIKLRSQTLKFDIGDELAAIYRYSDGLSFLDYCLLGILNKRIGRLTPPYLLEEKRLEFIGTCSGKQFLLNCKDNGENEVWFKDYNDGRDIVVACDVHEFFMKFLHKMDILLSHFDPKDIVVYFEDDMPPGLADW